MSLLLIIALASLALVLAAIAYCGLKVWHVSKRGMVFYGHVQPLADQLSAWSIVAEAKAQRLTENGAEIAANLERLRASLARLQIVATAFGESMEPIRRVRRYLGLNCLGL